MLDEDLLKKLYLYSQSLGMEPLVEVNTLQEMTVALRLGAKVIVSYDFGVILPILKLPFVSRDMSREQATPKPSLTTQMIS